MTFNSSWRSPSNIALIKYWGKYGQQLPRNPSLSFTLSACFTETSIQVIPESKFDLEVFYDGSPKPAFKEKILSFFSRIESDFPWLKNSAFILNSKNTFPHGAGIASSASAMSALALCIMVIDQQINGTVDPEFFSWSKASAIARLGSGSACRSVFPVAAVWGETPSIPGSSNEYALPWASNIHPIYSSFQDTILVVSDNEKSVSSTQGHALMDDHPYADNRFKTAHQNLEKLIQIMKDDEHLDVFISIVESEALQLHALMMSGHYPFILFHPNTIAIINEVWRFRKENQIPVCFTLDAGPNVHLLYPASFKSIIAPWIETTLKSFCFEGHIIEDHVGNGPEKMN